MKKFAIGVITGILVTVMCITMTRITIRTKRPANGHYTGDGRYHYDLEVKETRLITGDIIDAYVIEDLSSRMDLKAFITQEGPNRIKATKLCFR